MFAKDVMKKDALICTEEMPLMQVYEMMQKSGSDFITVVEDHAHQNPIGIVTEHDICMQVIGKGRNPRGLTAANVMNTNVPKTFETSTIDYCSDLIDKNRTKKLFVIDDEGKLRGTVTPSELEVTKATERFDDLQRSSFFSEFRNTRINRLF